MVNSGLRPDEARHIQVEMIEKYYASHIKNMLDADAINVMRPKRGC